LAHELGHGIFGLRHPFTEYNTTEKSTSLLMDYGSGTELSHNDWEIMHAPGLQLYQFTQGSSAGALAGGFAIAPDWSFVSNGDESTVANLNLAPKGFLGGFISNKDGEKVIYRWENNKYIGDNNIPLENQKSILTLNKSIIWLFFDNDKPINSNKYLRTLYNKELQNVLGTKLPKNLSAFIDKYATISNYKQTDEKRDTYWGYIACSNCNSDGTKQNIVDVTNQNVQIIRDCGTDAYIQKSLFTYNNDIATWGEVNVQFLNHNLNENKKNKFGDNLNSINLGGLKYINSSQQYNGNPIFEPKYIDELNNKLAYLEVSSGVQLHINFIETTCTFTQKEGDKFAKDIFENSLISKTKGVYALIVRNLNAQNVLEWKTYFAYGSDISEAIKTNANNLLTINGDNKFKSFGQSLIEFYKIVPKKQIQYIYEIELATDAEKNNPQEFEYKFLTKNINGKVITIDNQIGNAIKAKFYFKDTETNITKELNETKNIKELKEEFVSEQGLNLALVYAETLAGWKLHYKDIDVNNPAGEIRMKIVILDCKFTLNQSCTGEVIDKAFLVAGIATAPFGNVAIVIDGLAVIYYASTGQSDMAMMYIAGYALGPVLSETVGTIAKIGQKVTTFSEKLYVANRFSKLVNETVLTDAKVLEFLNKPVGLTNHEYLILDAQLGNGFIKVEENQILAGYVKVVNNSNEIYIFELKSGNHVLSSKYKNPTAEELEIAFKELRTLQGGNWITNIGKNIDELFEPPFGYQFYNYNGNKFLKRVNTADINTPRLTVINRKVIKYDGQTISNLSIIQVNDIATNATRNANATKVMLGKYNSDLNQVSYNRAAGNNYTFFEMDNWDGVFKLVNESKDEMWKINEQVIKNQFNANKPIYFSHNPNDINIIGAGSFYEQEIELLKQLVQQKYGKKAQFNPSNQYWKLEW
jgi:hypothetical protein